MSSPAIWPGHIEIRQRGGRGRTLRGSFPYNALATVRNRGRVRKERVRKGAFRYAVEDEDREVNLLLGHDFQAPLASKRAGSLTLRDGDALQFEAALPAAGEAPSWVEDAVRAVEGGLMLGVSPGFTVEGIEGAERLLPEPGNPGVQIREVVAALLLELSIVTRPAYPDTEVDLRSIAGLASSDALGGNGRKLASWWL